LTTIYDGVKDTTTALYAYQNSAFGILEGIKKNYNQAEFDVEQLQKTV
jgi:hypothetical protein